MEQWEQHQLKVAQRQQAEAAARAETLAAEAEAKHAEVLAKEAAKLAAAEATQAEALAHEHAANQTVRPVAPAGETWVNG